MIWLLAAALLQDDLTAREAARLADAGDAAALREREPSFWARAALDEIDARAKLGDAWPAPKRFSFSWSETPFDEAAGDVADAIGVEVRTQRDDEGTWDAVTLELEDVTPAEAVSALAAASGGIPSGGDTKGWSITPAWWHATKYAAWGNAAFTIDGPYRHQRVPFTQPPEATLSLSMQLGGAGALYQCCGARLKVTTLEAVDAKGRSLLRLEPRIEPARDGEYSDPDVAVHGEVLPTCDTEWPYLTVDLADPGDVEKIVRLRGTVELARAGKRISTVLNKIAEKPEGALGDLKLSFDDPSTEWGQTVLSLRVRRADGAGFGGVPPHVHYTLRAGEGEENSSNHWLQARWDGDAAYVVQIYLYEGIPDTLEVSLIEEETPFRVSFEFTDVEVGP